MAKMKTPEKHVQQNLGLAGQTGPRREYEPFVPGPNPELSGFIKRHSTPYDSATDKYDVTAFDRDIAVNKAEPPKAIYDMHTYWSKKHWAAIREYIRHYLPEKYYPKRTGLVLDCFSGSGMTGVAAMMEKRPCVLMDASPAAAFISHCYTHPVAPDELLAAYDEMMSSPYPDDLRRKLKRIAGRDVENLQQELDWLYETKCDRCGGPARTEYVVYSERFQCPRCGKVVPLFDCPEVKVPYLVGGKRSQKTEEKDRRVCPHCLRECGDAKKEFVVSARSKKFGPVPIAVSYICLTDCCPKRDQRRHDEKANTRKARFFQDSDVRHIDHIAKATMPHSYPTGLLREAIPYRLFEKMDFRPTDAQSVEDLFTKRNLWALAAIRASARSRLPAGLRESFLLAMNAAVFGVSRMVRESNTATMAGTYYLPQMSKAVNVVDSFRAKFEMMANCYAALPTDNDILVSVDDARSLEGQSDLDYIFTDPPYVDKIQYGELNYLWEAWLDVGPKWRRGEIIVNSYSGKTLASWDTALRTVFSRCYDRLKPGRWMSICYHDTDPGTWTRVQNAVRDTGFVIHSVTALDPKQKSQNQLNAEKIAKGDLVLNCLKPKPSATGEQPSQGDVQASQTSDRVRDIVAETLATTGGQTRDKLWDSVLKRLLTRGQMAEHRFEDILGEVAFKSESGRWFLKEEFESLSQNDIHNEEEAGAALDRFARLRCTGVPVAVAAQVALDSPRMAGSDVDEEQLTQYIRGLIKNPTEKAKFRLAGRMKGVEFYDCLFFYLTRYLKGRVAGKTPRRNMADFLEEYLVRFRDGAKWLYRPPSESEAASLKKSRQSGLGRRVRQYVAFLRGEGEFPNEKMPDVKTLAAWLKHCANFGLADEGVALYEKGGLMGQTAQLTDDERFDAEDYYAQCRRNASRTKEKAEESEDSAEQETE